MNKKGLTIAGAFAMAIVIGMFVMRGIGTGVQATNSDADFQITGSKLVSYKGTSRSVAIPSTVTEIGNQAFAGNTTVNMVTIPYSVTKIGYRAFSECTNLKTIEIPDSVTNIGPGAFYDCTTLDEVNIGEGVYSLGSGAFAGCSSLQKVTIDSDNPYLIYYAGALYNGDMTMLYQVFAGRQGENYVMPNTVEDIDTYAFWQCQNIKNVLVSNQVKDISAYAMTYMNSVENVVLTTGTTNISEKAFADNEALKQITIPVSVSNIDDTAFDKCPNLKIVTESNTTAEKYAKSKKIPYAYKAELATSFKDSMADELIPEDIKNSKEESTDTNNANADKTNTDQTSSETGNDAEDNNVEESSTEEQSTSEVITENPLDTPEGDNVFGKTIVVNGQAIVLLDNRSPKVYNSSKTKESTDEEVETEETVTDEEATTVSEEADPKVQNNGNKDNASNANTVESDATEETIVAERAYYKNINLTRYNVPEGTTLIGKLAFARTGLISITIPDTVKTIDYGAFYDCEDLNKVTISDQVENIEAKAFAKTAWLDNWLAADATDDPFLIVGDGILLAYRGDATDVLLPDTVKQIGAEAFKNHTEIVTVTVPKSVTKIGAKAFSGCSALEGLKGCEGLKAIVMGAFSGTNVTEETYQID